MDKNSNTIDCSIRVVEQSSLSSNKQLFLFLGCTAQLVVLEINTYNIRKCKLLHKNYKEFYSAIYP